MNNNNQSIKNTIIQNLWRPDVLASLGFGFMASLALITFGHEYIESGSFVAPFIALLVGAGIGWSLARHLSLCAHNDKDHISDNWFLLLIIVGSIIHTFFDGSVIHESFAISQGAGFTAFISVLAHEVVRTTIIFGFLRTMGFSVKRSVLSVFIVSCTGIILGILFSNFVTNYFSEYVVHLITGGLYTAIAIDLFYFSKHHFKKFIPEAVAVGVVLAYSISVLH